MTRFFTHSLHLRLPDFGSDACGCSSRILRAGPDISSAWRPFRALSAAGCIVAEHHAGRRSGELIRESARLHCSRKRWERETGRTRDFNVGNNGLLLLGRRSPLRWGEQLETRQRVLVVDDDHTDRAPMEAYL